MAILLTLGTLPTSVAQSEAVGGIQSVPHLRCSLFRVFFPSADALG
jgi:hypothetical protein